MRTDARKNSMKRTSYITPRSLFQNTKYISIPACELPPEADLAVSVEGDGMEPVFHDGQQVFLQECDSLFPYDPGVFIVNGKLYLRLFTVRDGKSTQAGTGSPASLNVFR